MTNIVEELSRRATPGYVGEQIKEATVRKTREIRQRAQASPYALPLIGGVVGAIAASYFGRSRSTTVKYDFGEIEEVTGYGGMEDESRGIAAQARALKDKASETLHDVSDKSSEAIAEVADRAVELGARAKNGIGRVLDEQPLLLGAGLAVLGALVAVLTPVTDQEKRILEPARKKAADGLQKLGEKLEEKLEGKSDELNGGSIDDGAGDGFEIGEGSFPPSMH